jgi:hypothetical protein
VPRNANGQRDYTGTIAPAIVVPYGVPVSEVRRCLPGYELVNELMHKKLGKVFSPQIERRMTKLSTAIDGFKHSVPVPARTTSSAAQPSSIPEYPSMSTSAWPSLAAAETQRCALASLS